MQDISLQGRLLIRVLASESGRRNCSETRIGSGNTRGLGAGSYWPVCDFSAGSEALLFPKIGCSRVQVKTPLWKHFLGILL